MKRKLVDLLLLLSCIAIVLLTFLALIGAKSAEHEAEAAVAEPALSSSTDVALAVPELTAAPESLSISELDKPIYNPAIPLSEDLQCILLAACEEHNVDPAIALGIIEVESGFDPSANNGLCYGLMQLNRTYFPSGLPAGENIQYGLEYLGQLLSQYGTAEAALTAYNAGHDTGGRVYANTVLAAAERWRNVVWAS